ncbi:MAG: hypothetical protein KME05_03315 [Gloeocapsa sp. UFS-A4-WI-NPMV-4B04]|jgi:hypothetical protein|nr:hypothetical protein [Gloeocapsa sp. UFS-A4-WI-NPMV-4B04]
MKVYVESCLNCPPDKVWDEVQKSSLFVEILYPLTNFVSISAETFPMKWVEGEVVKCKPILFGIIPTLGSHTIFFERVDQGWREIQTREKNALSHRWDHLIRVRTLPHRQTLYSDEIEIEAGLLTILVWSLANWFYRHRQRRWKIVAQRLVAE